MTEPSPGYKATHATYPDAPLPAADPVLKRLTLKRKETERRYHIAMVRILDEELGYEQTIPERTR